MMNAAAESLCIPEFLSTDSLRLLLFGGKGGVGKTSMAAGSAIAIARAKPKARVLLVSTDPAHSVADALADDPPPDNLLVIELSAEQEHQKFMGEHAAHLASIASRGTFLDAQDIDRFIKLSIPGLDELMAFIRIAQWLRDEAFDHIIVDTAPSGHTLRLLAMPTLLDTWFEAIEALLAKDRYMRGLFSRGRAAPSDDVDDFLEAFKESTDALREVMNDPDRCRFVPVMLPEAMSVAETIDVLAELQEMDVAAPELVINRVIPPDAGASFAAASNQQAEVLKSLPRPIADRTLFYVPMLAAEPRGVQPLERMISAIRPQIETPSDGPAPEAAGFRVESSAKPGGCNRSLVFFAGKGGTGKTTMAAARAIAEASRGRRTLIASTDPAHSLADCVRKELRTGATTLLANLDAVEIDAPADFEGFKDEYRDELNATLESMFETLDLSFDREAMERLIDLAPPGLDECMALVRITGLLEEGKYDTLVVDTAPTGHLLRLLELPELIDKWLQGLFSVFLRYGNIFRLPKLQARLVKLSRGLKKLRLALTDGKSATVEVVAIPTKLALAESGDLIAALREKHIPVDRLHVNLNTPAGPGPLAAAVRERERAARAEYARLFADVPTNIIYRTADPRGLDNLALLARAIAAPARLSE
jgi:arsenite-transporting ATPase